LFIMITSTFANMASEFSLRRSYDSTAPSAEAIRL
jgi:hypothetical protein